MERMKMRYMYRSEQREKWISLDEIYKLIKTETYGKRVSAVRQETLVSGHVPYNRWVICRYLIISLL